MGIAEMILLALPLLAGLIVVLDDGNFERKK
jgi:hypothetical protein